MGKMLETLNAYLQTATQEELREIYNSLKSWIPVEKSIEKRAESSVTFKQFKEGMDEKDIFLHNILMQGRREGYIKGAKEQSSIDNKKACDAYCMESCGHTRANCDCMSRMNIEKAIMGD